jgi:hypothetical protein
VAAVTRKRGRARFEKRVDSPTEVFVQFKLSYDEFIELCPPDATFTNKDLNKKIREARKRIEEKLFDAQQENAGNGTPFSNKKRQRRLRNRGY